MFGIGFGEMVVIAVLILIAVGPDKLPAMVKTVAKTYRQFRRTAMDIRASTGIDDLLRDEELRELADLRKQKLLAMTAKPAAKPIAKPVASAAAATTAALGGSSSPAGSSPAASASDDHDDYDHYGDAPIPAKPIASGLTFKQRTIEAPLEGVDVFEAQRAASVKSEVSIPETRAGGLGDAQTELASPGSGGAKADGGVR
ncbi:MAG: twin-arginine translocase TatA/TatE family subunit [Myxococcota bacterium]|nr:twin-arginine translocase TatA/TatE family subunit [Myxococcota bacterium]